MPQDGQVLLCCVIKLSNLRLQLKMLRNIVLHLWPQVNYLAGTDEKVYSISEFA